MMRASRPIGNGWSTGSRVVFVVIMLLTASALGMHPSLAASCVVPDNGTGTVDLPPSGCGYVSPSDLHEMIDGLPAGTTIQVAAEHNRFFGATQTPGGSLGGEVETFQSFLQLNMTGTGLLAGFSRLIDLQVACEVHTGPRTAGAPVQTFPNEMVQLQGQLFGDPDFDLLQIRAGSAFGLPSPGQTTLTRLTGGTFNVDSFFDIEYQIDFQGAPGGALAGMSGTTTGTVRMQGGEAAPPPLPAPGPCVVSDNGTGTVDLPPAGCGYVSPLDLHMMIDGLPAGTEIRVAAEHSRFFNAAAEPGGSLGGERENFDSFLTLNMTGTGLLSDFSRTLDLQVASEVHTGPRTPGDPVQSFPNDMFRLEGELFGDPDFDLLRIEGGTDFGLPSPGQTTLTQLGDGNFVVDSFFDVEYRIEFQGAPGGALDGLGGTTTGTVRMQAGQPAPPQPPPCTVADNGNGTVDLPPAGCGYVSPTDLHRMIDGLPPGTTINVSAQHSQFINIVSGPGGALGGEHETFDSFLNLGLEGTGLLAGFARTINVPLACEVHTGPRTPGDPVQTFPNDMFSLQGEIFGDPDFDLLRVRGGTSFGLPSPGQTTLTRLPSGDFNVDSFFDVEYQIEFQGTPGSVLEGLGGTTQSTVRMQSGQSVPPPQPPTCTVPDNGTGTVDLPPPGCGYVSPTELHRMIDGLPPGTTINVAAVHDRFFNVVAQPGGSLGGDKETFDSFLTLDLQGSGTLGAFARTLQLPVSCETHTGPRTPGDPVQTFPNDMFSLQGEIFGDPDFDLLRIEGGTSFGLPSPGQTTLTRLPSGNFNVDSFFDVEYRIEFQGAPGGQLDGLSGTTTGSVLMQSGHPPAECPPIQGGVFSLPSTAKLVLDIPPTPTCPEPPFVLRLSSAGLPDTFVRHEDQVGTTIDTEILSMDLTGSHPCTGQVNVQLNPSPTLPSLGQIVDVEQAPGTCELVGGDSFFDVFFVVDLPGLGETWTNTVPARLERRLHALPPKDDKYENPFTDPVVLFNVADGTPRGQILYHQHHVDPPFPPPGTDCFQSVLRLDLDLPTLGFNQTVFTSGSTMVERRGPFSTGVCSGGTASCVFDSDCPPGETCDSATMVQTEIVQMDLVGDDPLLGPITVQRSPSPPSLGQVQSQQPDRTYPADSFFDVFVDVDVQGMSLHTENGVPVAAIGSSGLDGITNIPPDPGTEYVSPPSQPFLLVDAAGGPVGQISNVVHRVGPPSDWQPPPPPEDYCFDSWIKLRITLFNPFCTEEFMLPGNFRILRTGADPADPLDLMETLMAKAVFTGRSGGSCTGLLGDLTLGLSPSVPSQGQLQSLAPAETFPVDSFFDVFVNMDTDAGRFHTQGPTHMTTTINSLPPEDGEIYYGPGTVIPLFDATGQQVGEILEVEHIVHRTIDCPDDYLSRLLITLPDGIPGAAAPPGIPTITVGIPAGGAGLRHDVVKGSTISSGASPFNAAAACFADNLSGAASDPLTPAVGEVFVYVAREEFGAGAAAFVGTYDSGGAGQVGPRDPPLAHAAPCPP